MRCTGYCTAGSYDTHKLFHQLQSSGAAHLHKDVVHFEVKHDRAYIGDIYYFSYGCVVFWGINEEEELFFLSKLKDYEKEIVSRIERDDFTYSYGENLRIEEDEIILQNKSPLTKLAISHGIAQSVKLATFEESINKTINNSKSLPTELARNGKIPLSRKGISKKLGELFVERNFVNLNSEILDTPEYFWEFPEFEPFYRKTAHYLDVTKRVETMNRRLSVIHDLYEILSNELNHQHSSRLEWTIIILIVIEVLMALFRDFL